MKQALEELLKNIADLFKVKTIISLGMLSLVIKLALAGTITGDKIYELFLIIIGFYFGTQASKIIQTVQRVITETTQTTQIPTEDLGDQDI